MVEQNSNTIMRIDNVPTLLNAIVGVVHTFRLDILRADALFDFYHLNGMFQRLNPPFFLKNRYRSNR